MSLRSPLGRVLGKGSAQEGVGHWWTQRLTALALIPLTIWFVLALLGLETLSYATVHEWLGRPANALGALILVIALLWHSHLGVQVVVEDYVHHEGLKVLARILLIFTHALAGAVAVYAILMVALAHGSAL